MSLWKDAKSPALKTEEAALLPAISRHMARGAALKTVLQAEKRMDEMKRSAPRAAGITDQPFARTQRPAVPAGPGSRRSALYQVWKR